MKKKAEFIPDEKAMERLKVLLPKGSKLAIAAYNPNRAQNARDIKAFVIAPDSEGKAVVKNICADLADVLDIPWQGDGSVRYAGGGMNMGYAFACHVARVLYDDASALEYNAV